MRTEEAKELSDFESSLLLSQLSRASSQFASSNPSAAFKLPSTVSLSLSGSPQRSRHLTCHHLTIASFYTHTLLFIIPVPAVLRCTLHCLHNPTLPVPCLDMLSVHVETLM